MAKQSDDRDTGLGAVLDALPTDRLMEQTRDFASALGERAVSMATDKVGDLTDRLLDYVENGGSGNGDGGGGGKPSAMKMLMAAGSSGLKQVMGGGKGGKGKGGGRGGKLKVTNIVEEIDVGVPVRVAYNQWTQFQDFPKYTKRLESVEQADDQKLSWKAGIFLSHRTWESTIVEQVPDELIVWRSKGEKGSADGTVTFHEIAPNLTKILLVLEYHPQGLFERTGNLWRAQGRRARLELKHFRRHVMTHVILDQDSVEGWRGEIRDGKVVRSHEDALEEEGEEGGEPTEEPEESDEAAESEDDYGEGEPEDEEDFADEDADDEPEDEDDYEAGNEADEEEDEEPQDEDDYDEPTDEEDYEDDEYGDGEETDEDEYDYDDEPEDEPEDEEQPTRRGSRRTLVRSR